MKNINWFYIALVLLIPTLFYLLKPENENEVAFFGFAENLETEINYNYDVVVDKILVSPGQEVFEGSPLMKISRRKSKEVLEDQSYQIRTLEAEESAWKLKKRIELEKKLFEKDKKLLEFTSDITKLEKEIAFKKSLIGSTDIAKPETGYYSPLKDELEVTIKEMNAYSRQIDQEIKSLKQEINLGSNPYRARVDELEAERDFDSEHKIRFIDVKAPTKGLIGNIYCKEAEHVPAFKTLLSFYEPHSGIIKGYVHEDLNLNIFIGDKFIISSLKDEEVKYEGNVIGLGSRIVEIPERLGKFPQIKSYGREITIEISSDNIFLQKEKVGLKLKT